MITLIEFIILFGAILLGVRFGGIALGFWGGAGLFILSVVFGVMPTSPPVDVMLIILAVCMCAACMEAVGAKHFCESPAQLVADIEEIIHGK